MGDQIDFTAFEKALKTLQAALDPPPANDRERDGAIQRFEYTFEMAWKIAGKVLKSYGVDARNARNIIRELAAQGWIEDGDEWIRYLNMRNLSSHTYHPPTADEVFEAAKDFASNCQALLNKLKDLTKE